MHSETERHKRLAAERAADWIEDGMVLGLGTGSTVRHLLDHIAEQRSAGRWGRIVGVPTSNQTRERAERLGIPLTTLQEHPEIDLTIDGADEVDPALRLIKGLGGALLREKVVAVASARVVIMVDRSKRVERLGTRAPLPVEVDAFSVPVQPRFFRSLGAECTLRQAADGGPFTTDGGNHIFDCRFEGGIDDPGELETRLATRAGVLETGLFIGIADAVVVAGERVEVLERARDAVR